MAEELNVHFSSVFTREDTSSLPVPETKFNGSEEEKLGQLVVTPEVVASKINNMKENKSPGVDGLSPKILKETVEQISKPLLLRRVLDIYCQIDSSQCLAQLTPARVGKARSANVQLGASPHVIR